MAFPKPPENKSAIRRAGEAVAEGQATDDDLMLLDRWRGAHGFALNTFQASLRRRIGAFSGPVDFVQRLKRRNTVFDKLRRKREDGVTPLVKDVTAMNDFAGCRLIFASVDDLNAFRSQMHAGFAEHQLRNEPDKYDYIENPKGTGYRGIHDVYSHRPRSHRRGDTSNQPWQNLRVEIQYRTRAQNSWATAVELADIMDRERTKFGHGEGDRGLFFRIASEIIARQHEGLTRAWPEKSLAQLRAELAELESELAIVNRLTALRAHDGSDHLGRHNVFNIVRDECDPSGFRLEISVFKDPLVALEAANEAESSLDSINAVYVRADNPAQLRAAYKNYFGDSVSFVELLRPPN
ncbi:RelA/SpoT domain-containing protein [Pontibaca methylaminivorans]|uniref:RelA/SpoT domain-containing protein n=1 Tax=Pontibaca methylaminivorans TaxID=515897 RepID=A0A1R3WA81_9RHOB|nr:RelA/SpoT domain-containing protein [Pontibaca methylaminivorans]SIT74670.1 hypothetical protein SAMN05421849_0195 [Pontibaca methylaminivorans]